MKIRPATKFDHADIMRMLNQFKLHTPIAAMAECDNQEYVSSIITHILYGRGIILVAEKADETVGMMIGYIDKTIWDPNMLMLSELAFWVEPEHRGSTAGYKLLKKYTEEAKKLKEMDRIAFYTMSRMTNSPNIDYGRFGYTKIEEHWVGGI